ncbi:MAG: FHA domain-containing protein [Actinobacteria bacterium]|nr:FHA domain-containing protein [Actinomycetota bacterium]
MRARSTSSVTSATLEQTSSAASCNIVRRTLKLWRCAPTTPAFARSKWDASCWVLPMHRWHAQLRRRPNGWTLRDLGSTNGTKLNGVRVEGEQMLTTGDVIMLGALKATFEIS